MAEAKSVRTVRLLLAGPSGAGKSTLGNTLLLKYTFKESITARPMTRRLQKGWLPLQVEGEACKVEVIDTIGYTGKTKLDEQTDQDLRVTPFDLILLCSEVSSNSGRAKPTYILGLIKRLVREKGIFTEEVLRKKAVIVLTQANALPPDVPNARNEVDAWIKEYRDMLLDPDEMGEAFLDLPVFMAGRFCFNEPKKGKTPIDGSTQWFDDLWTGIGQRTDTALCAGVLTRAAQLQSPANENSHRETPAQRVSLCRRLLKCLRKLCCCC